MINRRTTLKIGAVGAISGLVNLPAQARALAASKSSALPVQAIYDSAFSESLAFANAIQVSGSAAAKDIQGDLGKLWYEQLRSQLLSDRRPIIGLTTRLDLFCLEELARDVGMKVSLRVDHLIDQHGKVEHQVNGSPLSNSSLDNLGHSAGFGSKMAELSELLLADQSADIAAQKLTGPNAPANKTALVTWVIS